MLNTVQILKRIKSVMLEVVALDKPLCMKSFLEDSKAFNAEKPQTIHTCQTAACVLGYFAISEKSHFLRRQAAEMHTKNMVLHGIDGEKVLPSSLKIGGWIILWSLLDDRAEKECLKSVYDSVFDTDAFLRRINARETNVFSQRELDSIDFLQRDEVTAQDAVDYLSILIEKLEAKNVENC